MEPAAALDPAPAVQPVRRRHRRRGYSKSGYYALKTTLKVLGPRVIDKRTSIGKALAAWRADLMRDLGGADALSTQQRALVELLCRQKLLRAAKLPHFTPHSLRHTYASLLLIAGIDVYYVSRMLGHASITETVDTYGRWLPANRKGALDVLDTPAAPSTVTTCDQTARS